MVGASPGALSKQVDVRANLGWQDTGVDVRSGDRLRIQSVSGSWSGTEGRIPLHDAAGPTGAHRYVCAAGGRAASTCAEAVPDAIKGSLVGRVGGHLLKVGNLLETTATANGPLQLRMNDGSNPGDLVDNGGAVAVRVAVQR